MRSCSEKIFLQETIDLDIGFGDRVATGFLPAPVGPAKIAPGNIACLPQQAGKQRCIRGCAYAFAHAVLARSNSRISGATSEDTLTGRSG